MHVEWYGQSAFALTGEDARSSSIRSPTCPGWRDRGMNSDYPPIEEDDVDLLLITHEHVDHNGVERDRRRAGIPPLHRRHAGVADRRGDRGRLRARCRRRHRARPEHDLRLRPRRRPRRPLRRLRPARAAARAGRGPRGHRASPPPRRRRTHDRRDGAATIVEALEPRWVVPMHYRTPRIGFLETEEEFVGRMPRADRLVGERLRHRRAAGGGRHARCRSRPRPDRAQPTAAGSPPRRPPPPGARRPSRTPGSPRRSCRTGRRRSGRRRPRG